MTIIDPSNPLAVLSAIGEIVDSCVYPLEDGCLKNYDYNHHKRAKNWVAFVRPDRACPGGLERDFWSKGSGRWYKAPAAIEPGHIVEMAGDYYTARGSKVADRRYLLVVRVEADHIVARFLGVSAPSSMAVRRAEEQIKAWCAS